MSDIITDWELQKRCDEAAAEIFEEFKEEHGADFDPADHLDDMRDRAHDEADGWDWTIYTHKALLICCHCNTDMGEEFLDDVGMPQEPTLASIASRIVYGEIRGRIEVALQELADDYEPPEIEEEDAA